MKKMMTTTKTGKYKHETFFFLFFFFFFRNYHDTLESVLAVMLFLFLSLSCGCQTRYLFCFAETARIGSSRRFEWRNSKVAGWWFFCFDTFSIEMSGREKNLSQSLFFRQAKTNETFLSSSFSATFTTYTASKTRNTHSLTHIHILSLSLSFKAEVVRMYVRTCVMSCWLVVDALKGQMAVWTYPVPQRKGGFPLDWITGISPACKWSPKARKADCTFACAKERPFFFLRTKRMYLYTMTRLSRKSSYPRTDGDGKLLSIYS